MSTTTSPRFKAVREGNFYVIRDRHEVARYKAWRDRQALVASAAAVLAELPDPPRPTPFQRVGGVGVIDFGAKPKPRAKPVTASASDKSPGVELRDVSPKVRELPVE